MIHLPPVLGFLCGLVQTRSGPFPTKTVFPLRGKAFSPSLSKKGIDEPPPATNNWSHFDPKAYLRDYYSHVGLENLALWRFLVRVFSDLPRGGRLLEFGGGPTLYSLIPAANSVDEIHFCDYSETNLQEVRGWLQGDADAFDWTHFVCATLELEGRVASIDSVRRRGEHIKRLVTKVMRANGGLGEAAGGPA